MDSLNDYLISVKINRIIPKNPTEAFKFISPQEFDYFTKSNDNFELENSFSKKLSESWKLLPQNINKTYLGEIISFCFTFTNDSVQETLYNVNCEISIDLNDGSLLIGQFKERDLAAKQCDFLVVHHEIKHLEKHLLTCLVSYKLISNEIKTFKKTYQFIVDKPLDVKTKFYFTDDSIVEDIYLEATLQNQSILPICLEEVYLEPIRFFEVIDLNYIQKENNQNQLVFGKINRFNQDDFRQYLFCLKVKNEYLNNLNELSSIDNVGKLNIIWTSSLGIKGHLQTPHLSRDRRNYANVQFTIKKVPDDIKLNEEFIIKLSFSNYSSQDILPCLFFDNKDINNQNVLWLGISGLTFTKVESGKSFDFEMNAISTKTGLQVIPPLRIEDQLNNKVYHFKEKIYVNVI